MEAMIEPKPRFQRVTAKSQKMEINFDSILNTKKNIDRKREAEEEEFVKDEKREHFEEYAIQCISLII